MKKTNPDNSSPLVGHWSQTICPLSPRECEILMSLAEGKSNKMIARLYGLSKCTVKIYLKAILRKTKAQNRTQAVIWAFEHGLRDKPSEHRSIVSDAPSLALGTTDQGGGKPLESSLEGPSPIRVRLNGAEGAFLAACA